MRDSASKALQQEGKTEGEATSGSLFIYAHGLFVFFFCHPLNLMRVRNRGTVQYRGWGNGKVSDYLCDHGLRRSTWQILRSSAGKTEHPVRDRKPDAKHERGGGGGGGKGKTSVPPTRDRGLFSRLLQVELPAGNVEPSAR